MDCPTHKRPYTSESQADSVLGRIWRRAWRRPGKLPRRAYACELCGGWHLTSLPLSDYQQKGA